MFKTPLKFSAVSLAIAMSLPCANADTFSPFYQQSLGSPTSADRYFNDAERESRRADGGQMYQYQDLMSGSVLEMYPEYWQLNQDLNSQSPDTIINFVKRYQGSVIAEKLVADFAETKANAGDYQAVRQVANYITNADASEACAIGLGFNQSNDTARSYVEKANVWLDTDKKQPELCKQLATQMNYNPMINNSDREQRLYRMLRTGNSGDVVQLASRLGVALDYQQLSMIASSPNQFLFNMSSLPANASNRYYYLYALGRLAQTSVMEASSQLNYDLSRFPQFFDEKTRRYAYRTLGVARMNMNTDLGFSLEAVEWMQKSLGEPFNFEEAEDYAQASIRFSRWADVANAIGAMDFKAQQQRIWQYWLAKAYNYAGNGQQKQQAKQMFSKLAQKNDYYGLLAKDEIGQSFNQLPTAPNPTNADYNRLTQNPNFQRAFTLYNISASPAYTNREWNWAVRQADKKGDTGIILSAVQQANNMQWYDRAIFAIETSDNIPNSALAYPMPRQDLVVNYSNRFGIDPAWAYGIMRQESRFNTGAKSGVGASGLMQVMPATAKEVARDLGESYSASSMNNADTNIRYGTYYLSKTLNKLGGQPVLATAGYNAGATKANRWQPDMGSLPADQYVESIPYPETRGYVKAVMENTMNYRILLHGGNQSIKQYMGIIPAKY